MSSQDVVDFVSQRMAQGVTTMSTICEDVSAEGLRLDSVAQNYLPQTGGVAFMSRERVRCLLSEIS